MTDYKNLKLIATSSPHIRAAENTRSIMLDVIIAMMPALIWAIVKFGFRALTLTAVSVVGCMFFEWGYRKLMKKPQSVNDLSAVVTGILLAFVCPVNMPYWMILVGDFFAIVVVKQLFGGIGKNFVNPALAGRAALVASYAGTMMYQYASKGMVEELNDAHIMDCMECGACSYICPARMHLTHMFKTGKQLVKDKAAADRAAAEAKKKAEEAKEAAAK